MVFYMTNLNFLTVQAVQGPQGCRWTQGRPIRCYPRRPHHPLPRPSRQGQRHREVRHRQRQDRGLHQVRLRYVLTLRLCMGEVSAKVKTLS